MSKSIWSIALAALMVVAGGCGGPSAEDEKVLQIGANNVYTAALNGDLESVRSFIESGRWNSQRPDGAGITPLNCAVEGGNIEIVKLMVENGADVNQIDARLVTPLQVAEKAGNQEMVEALKALGATK